jgi:hypothetical protein
LTFIRPRPLLTRFCPVSTTGICYVGGLSDTNLLLFVIIPLCVYLLLGCLFLTSGFVSLFRIRSALREQSRGKTDKLEKLMLRIVVFSVLYIVPGVVVIGCNLYEYWNRDAWATSHNCACDRPSNRYSNDVMATDHNRPLVHSSERPLYFVFLLKYIMCLGVGITSGFWIFSRKTIRSWARFYGRCCCCGSDCVEAKRPQINNRAPAQLHRQSSNSVTAALMSQPAASMGSHQAMGSMSMGTAAQSGSQIMSSASQLGHARSYKQLLQQQQLQQQMQQQQQLQQQFQQQQHQQQHQQQQHQQQFAANLGLVGFGSVSTPRTGSNSGSSISHAKLPLSHV